MWIADGWKDYEVIDCSRGEKLERWGRYLLVRPDPQVIWDTDKKAPQWRKMNGHYHRSSKGGGECIFTSIFFSLYDVTLKLFGASASSSALYRFSMSLLRDIPFSP